MTKSLLFEPETTTFKLRTRELHENNMGDSNDQSNNITLPTPFTQNGSLSNDTTTAIPGQTITTNYSSTNVTGDYWSTTLPPHKDAGGGETAVVIIIVIAILAAFLALTCYCLKKKGKLTKLPCYRPVSRKRRSSTSSSRRALEEHEVMENDSRPKPDGQADDMFTIDEFETIPDPQEGKEEYYYDEVFGQSQFEDETTNNAMRQLYSDHEAEEEILDLDFETLGIKIEDYGLNGLDPGKKNTV